MGSKWYSMTTIRISPLVSNGVPSNMTAASTGSNLRDENVPKGKWSKQKEVCQSPQKHHKRYGT